jgi:CubicO group peptidase (beta-lactamase class C family)
MKYSALLTLALSSFALAPGCHAGVPGNNLASKIDHYMNAAMKVDHFMGAILVARDGHIIIAKGYGLANAKSRTMNTPHTEFRIGSVTKQFTSMAIMVLQADGKLNVHDPVCKYVSKCPKDWHPITIYNLLTHTSGIPDFTKFSNYSKVRSKSMTPAQLVALFKNKPLDFKPGAKFKYSNSGYVLLGYIIEKTSGESYKRFLQQHIFGPLGMKNSGYGSSHPAGKNHARGYKGYDPTKDKYLPASYINMSVPFSAGALYSSVRDLYTWDRALAADKLLPKKLHEQMFAPQVLVGGAASKIIGGSSKVFYGYGWFISTEFGHKMYSHEGGIAGFTSLNSWFPDQHAYVIVLDNVTSPHIFHIAKSLGAILFGKQYTIPKTQTAIHLPATALEKFVGTYQLSPKFSITITRKGDQLKAQATGQPAFLIFPETKTEFFLKAVDAQISFQTNDKGEVTGLVLHQNGLDAPGKKIK